MGTIIFVGVCICFAFAAQTVTKSGSGFATSDSSGLSLFRTDLAGNLTYSSYTSVSKYFGPPIIDANRTTVYTITQTTNYIIGVAKWNYIGATPQFESYCAFPSTIPNLGLVLDDSVPPRFYGLRYLDVQTGAYAVWRITNINNCTVENATFRTIYLKQSSRISSLISFRGGVAIVIEPSPNNSTIFCVNHYNFVSNTLLESTCSLSLTALGVQSYGTFSWDVDYVTGDIYVRKNLFNRVATDIWVLRRSSSNDGYLDPWTLLGHAPSNLGLQIGDADDCSPIIIDYDNRWYFRSTVASETLTLDVIAQSPLLQWSLASTGGGWVVDQYYSNGTSRARCSARPGRVFTTSTSSSSSSSSTSGASSSSTTTSGASSSSSGSDVSSTGTTTSEESENSGAFKIGCLLTLIVTSCVVALLE